MNDIDRMNALLQAHEERYCLFDQRTAELQMSASITSDRLSTQSQDMAALRKRIEALEGQGNRVGGTVPESSAVTSASPAPPASLVERIAALFVAERYGVDEPSPEELDLARAALLVAADELLGPITGEEMDVFDSAEESSRQGIDRVLRRRLARAKEAAK